MIYGNSEELTIICVHTCFHRLVTSQCRTHVMRSAGRSDYSELAMASNASLMHAYTTTESGVYDRICDDTDTSSDCVRNIADQVHSDDNHIMMRGYVVCFEEQPTAKHARSLATGISSLYGILKGPIRHSIINESCVQLSATPIETHRLLHEHTSRLISSIRPVAAHAKFSREHLTAATGTLDSDSDAFILLVALTPGVAPDTYAADTVTDSYKASKPSTSGYDQTYPSSSSSSSRTMRSLMGLISQLPCELSLDAPPGSVLL
jgi:hypothetical protein